jgi:hypothetical protein
MTSLPAKLEGKANNAAFGDKKRHQQKTKKILSDMFAVGQTTFCLIVNFTVSPFLLTNC